MPLPFSVTMDSGFRTTRVSLTNEVREHISAAVPHRHSEHREWPGLEFRGKRVESAQEGVVPGVLIQSTGMEMLKLLLEVAEKPPLRAPLSRAVS